MWESLLKMFGLSSFILLRFMLKTTGLQMSEVMAQLVGITDS